MAEEKKLYAIYHLFDEDGGFGDAIPMTDMVAIVSCTKEEIDKFIEKYDKPIVYSKPYAELACHSVYAQEITITDLAEVKPYGPDDWYGQQAVNYYLRKEYGERYGGQWWCNHELTAQFYKEKKERLKKEGYDHE